MERLLQLSVTLVTVLRICTPGCLRLGSLASAHSRLRGCCARTCASHILKLWSAVSAAGTSTPASGRPTCGTARPTGSRQRRPRGPRGGRWVVDCLWPLDDRTARLEPVVLLLNLSASTAEQQVDQSFVVHWRVTRSCMPWYAALGPWHATAHMMRCVCWCSPS
jgi:hypothetical protein